MNTREQLSQIKNMGVRTSLGSAGTKKMPPNASTLVGFGITDVSISQGDRFPVPIDADTYLKNSVASMVFTHFR